MQVFIGGTGNSGTRALVEVLSEMGVYFPLTPPTHDTLAFVPIERDENEKHMMSDADMFYRLWLGEGIPPIGTDIGARIAAKLTVAAASVQGDKFYNEPCGAKLPRFLEILPLVDHVFPKAKFIHVVRHVMRFPNAWRWGWVNSIAADWGENEMPGRYLRLRYEDLCRDPLATVMTLNQYLNLNITLEEKEAAAEKIRPSTNQEFMVFCTRKQLAAARMPVQAIATMDRFGYLKKEEA